MKKTIVDFSGGYNDTVPNVMLHDNEFSEFTNVDPLPSGGCKVRNGTKKINILPFPDKISQMIEWPLKSGVTKTIVVAGRKMYEFSSVLGEWHAVMYDGVELLLQTDIVSYAFFRDYFYFSDGKKMYRWNDNVFYLSSLDEYEHHFKKGDIIKLTVSEQESLFRNQEGNLMDVRNLLRSKFSYVYKDRFYNGVHHYQSKDVYNVKYKFVDSPESKDGKTVRKMYVLKYPKYRKNGRNYTAETGYFEDLVSEKIPYHGEFMFRDGEDINDGRESYFYLQQREDAVYVVDDDYYLESQFEYVGNVGDYYQFTEDVTDFYPHNFNYITHEKYLSGTEDETELKIVPVDESAAFYQITEVQDIPPAILSCQHFCFYPRRQRFLAAGNPNDPMAIYVSHLGTFESWDESVTVYPDTNLGAVTGLCTVNGDVVICFENGFSYLDSELFLIDSNESTVEYIPRLSSVPVGVSSPNTLCVVPYGLCFYHGENIYMASFSLFGKNYVKTPSSNEYVCLSLDRCENILKGSRNHRAVYHDHRYYLYFTDKETKDRILIYDFKHDNFRLYSNVGVTAFISRNKDNKLLISSGKNVLDAFCEGCFSDYRDEGNCGIEFAIRSKYYDPKNNGERIEMRLLQMVMSVYKNNSSDGEKNEEESNMNISLLGDRLQRDIVDNLGDGILWNNSKWNYNYAWNQEFVIHNFNLLFATNRIGFRISSTSELKIDEPLAFYYIGLEFENSSKDGTKNMNVPNGLVDMDFQKWPDRN